MKLVGIVMLSVAALGVLLVVVLPAAIVEFIALIIHRTDTHGAIARPGFLLPVVANPLSALLVSGVTLLLIGWGIRKLSRLG